MSVNPDVERETSKEADLKLGLDYWATIPASIDGVLGGFGEGMLPHVDALGSRQTILAFMPNLCTVPSALRKLDADSRPLSRRIRALDVGAGIGRVTSTVLLPLVHDVVLLEPMNSFINEALRLSSSWRYLNPSLTPQKSVTFLKGTLQAYDPTRESNTSQSGIVNLGRRGYTPSSPDEEDAGFDIVWCQWCVGHMKDAELVAFLQRSQASLRKRSGDGEAPAGVIFVKENVCPETEEEAQGEGVSVYDDLDASVTRSHHAWLAMFRKAGLTLLREETQLGLPQGLYTVKTYALR